MIKKLNKSPYWPVPLEDIDVRVLVFTSLYLSFFMTNREVENELEAVWEAAARENQHLQDIVMSKVDVLLNPHDSPLSLAWKPQETFNQACHLSNTMSPTFIKIPKQSSAMFKSDSQQHHNLSSDESERNGLDYYS